MEGRKLKGVFIVMAAVMLLPFAEHALPFITSGKLQGYFTNAEDADFSWKEWFNGEYQRKKSDYCNDHTGFRPDLVRLSGQIDFSLFRRVDYGGTVMEADNSLYYEEYIDSYFGKNFLGYDRVYDQVRKLKAIQDTLERAGKFLVFVHAPCKAFYNADAITDLNKCSGRNVSNFEVFRRLSDSLGVKQIDMNTWFVSMKKTTKELLFSKQGIHWTLYGGALGADSLIKYLEKLRNIRLPHLQMTNIERTTKARNTDDDIARVLNLIFPVAVETFTYPEIHYTSDSNTKKLNMIYIGDSFGWTLYTDQMMQNINSDWEFWYYFKEMHKGNVNAGPFYTKMKEYDWKSRLATADGIVMIYTSTNLPKMLDGFIDQGYAYYYPGRQ